MTNEELDFIGSLNMHDEISNEAYKKIMCHCEEQEPCEDCISRSHTLSEFKRIYFDNDTVIRCAELILCNELSVKPKQKAGNWIPQNIHNCHTDFKCSECGYIHKFMHLYGEPVADYTYCPNCGARMEGTI